MGSRVEDSIREVIEALSEGFGEIDYEESEIFKYGINNLHQKIQESLVGDFGGKVGYSYTNNKGNKELVIELTYTGDSRRVYSKDNGMLDSSDYISGADLRILNNEVCEVVNRINLKDTDLNKIVFRIEFGVNLDTDTRLPYNEIVIYDKVREVNNTEDEVYMEFVEIGVEEEEDIAEVNVI